MNVYESVRFKIQYGNFFQVMIALLPLDYLPWIVIINIGQNLIKNSLNALESNEKKTESGVESMLQISSTGCIPSCNFRASLVICKVAAIIMAMRNLTMVARQSCYGKISIRSVC